MHIEKLETLQMASNALLMSSIFSNLIENAIKYTPENKNIYISLYKEVDAIVFVIRDEGIGIEVDEIPKITERFYRTDRSRNKKIKGFGLGLSIVKKGVILHNGTMKIESVVNEGTTVRLSFKGLHVSL